MTEREIPDPLGFLFGGMTDDSDSTFAPLRVREPDFVNDEAPSAPRVFLSRREARAAGAYNAAANNAGEAAATAAPNTAARDIEAPNTAAPDIEAPAAELSTQAMAVTEIAEELATPVAPLVVHQDPITAIAPVIGAVIPVPVPVPSPAHGPADFSAAFNRALAAEAVPPADTRRSRRAAAPASAARASRTPDPREPRAKRVRTAADRKSFRQQVTGLGVMVLVGGLFAVLALPAYADNDASALSAASAIRTQKLTVTARAASETTTTDSSRDSYTATSAQDLKALYSSALMKQNVNDYLQSGAKAAGDDYPWYAELSRNQGGGLSPLNYYYRECVDFVAWRLNRDAGDTTAPFKWTWATLTPNGGNASQWKSAWLSHGWATGTTPQVGAVAWFNSNHVAYVSGLLNDGSVLIEEYNWQGEHLYGSRIIQPGDAYYLYAPPA